MSMKDVHEKMCSSFLKLSVRLKRVLDAENHKQNGMQANTKFLSQEEYL